MGRVLHVYCDESRQRNEKFMVLGGIITSASSFSNFNLSITEFRSETRMFAEMKWRKVSRGKLNEYKRFLDFFFTLNESGHAYFYVMIINTH